MMLGEGGEKRKCMHICKKDLKNVFIDRQNNCVHRKE